MDDRKIRVKGFEGNSVEGLTFITCNVSYYVTLNYKLTIFLIILAAISIFFANATARDNSAVKGGEGGYEEDIASAVTTHDRKYRI